MRKPFIRPTIFQVIGELLMTVGTLALLYVGWELGWTNVQVQEHQQSALHQAAHVVTQKPPATQQEGAWGILYVPKMGESFAAPIADGVDADVIDSGILGRYDSSTDVGKSGNLTLAGHRQTYGSLLWDLDKVSIGDKMYLQTQGGFWTYEVKKSHIVRPNQSEVLDSQPMKGSKGENTSWLTLTTCHPPYTTWHRLVTHAELVSFSKSAPSEIAPLVSKVVGE